MRIAYIIHAFQLPVQLGRLVRALDTVDSHFFIHVDRRVEIAPFKQALSKYESRLTWVERECSHWGTVRCVYAVLNALFAALHHREPFDYFCFLSGQDYPIKPNDEIRRFLEQHRNTDFVEHFALPRKNWDKGGAYRYRRYHFVVSKNKYVRRLVNLVNFWLPRRAIPYGLKPYCGSFYFALSRKSAEYIERFTETHPRFVPFFRYSYIPEEMVIHTILMNGPEEIRGRVHAGSLTHVDWSRPRGPYPATLGAAEVPALLRSSCLFARKFDTREDPDILDLLDRVVLKRG